jgi:hypothetical protein
LIQALAGMPPVNFDDLNEHDQQMDAQGRRYAAQRGIISDEVSKLLFSGKRYMEGIKELLLNAYDARTQEEKTFKSMGKIVIRNIALNILGATTPEMIAARLDGEAWMTGEMARYALLTPDRSPIYMEEGTDFSIYNVPPDLINRLARLHYALPSPPAIGEDAIQTAIRAHYTEAAHDAFKAYDRARFEIVSDGDIHPNIRGNYTRLPALCEKIAISLAAIDWADLDNDEAEITITLGHWARAQQIAELWRASLHRFLYEVTVSKDARAEQNIESILRNYPEGRTLRDLTRQSVGLNRDDIMGALRSLMEAGLAVQFNPNAGQRGRPTTAYKLVKN